MALRTRLLSPVDGCCAAIVVEVVAIVAMSVGVAAFNAGSHIITCRQSLLDQAVTRSSNAQWQLANDPIIVPNGVTCHCAARGLIGFSLSETPSPGGSTADARCILEESVGHCRNPASGQQVGRRTAATSGGVILAGP